MATSSKFDISASSERPPYPSGPRGLYSGTSLERSGSFRESMDNQMSRSSFRVTQGDVHNYFECLNYPEHVGSDNNIQQLGELKKIALQEDLKKGRSLSLLSPEGLKKTKAALQENRDEARERAKTFGEALSMSKKFFPSVPVRKRSRSDAVTNDRTNFVPLHNRSGIGPRTMKMGAPEKHKSEERTKNTKRTRTSISDARANSLSRQSTPMDKDRSIGRGVNSGIVLDSDQKPPIDSWERSKTKKTRSVIKADASPSKSSPKSSDSHREQKQGVRRRLATDFTFRSRVGNGTVGIRKLDGVTDSIARFDHENGILFGKEKTSDKERLNLRTINKSGRREDYNSPSPSSSAKLISSTRPPQLNKGILQPPNSCSDWEILPCTNSPSTASGSTNKKRTSSARSYSPPVSNWTGQRPQKILYPAKRTNFLPVVPNNEEVMSDTDNDKFKQFSESEESGFAETKKETKKLKKIFSKADGRAAHNIKKASSTALPAHKKKLVSGDGLKRHGRGRSLISSRSLMPTTVDKFGNIAAAKQPRTGRINLDKAPGKVGRPPMRKLSDRKAYTSSRLSALQAVADIDDDGQKELIAAAKAVVDTSHLSSFWRHMELIFKFTSEADIGFLKQQDEFMCHSNTQKVTPSADANGPGNCLNELLFSENMGHVGLIHATEELIPDHTVHSTIPLCQRLIAALITDEEDHGAQEKHNSCETGYQRNAALDISSSNGFCLSFTDHQLHESFQNFGDISSSDYMYDGLLPNSEIIPITESTEGQYSKMSLDERLLLEVQSLGISYEQPEMRDMDNEEVSQEIRRLNEEYHHKVSKRRCFTLNLSKSALQSKECEESNFERLALDKLVTMAYAKYMASIVARGPSSKTKQQNALAFVERAIEHCKRHESTGISCFSEPLYKHIFSSTLNKITENEPSTPSGLQQSGDLDSSSSEPNKMKKSNNDLRISSTKGKRSKARTGKTKLGRPVSANINGDKKSKSKSKPKTTNPEKNKASSFSSPKKTEEFDFSNLDVGLGGQGDDLASWLNIDDDSLQVQDIDFMGLEIPMDDLSEVNMMV